MIPEPMLVNNKFDVSENDGMDQGDIHSDMNYKRNGINIRQQILIVKLSRIWSYQSASIIK